MCTPCSQTVNAIPQCIELSLDTTENNKTSGITGLPNRYTQTTLYSRIYCLRISQNGTV